MKLTIVPSDGLVCKDNVCYVNLTWEGTPANVHALQWQDVAGWIEFNDGSQNEDITTLPQWSDNAIAAWDVADYNANHPPAPTPEQIQAQNKSIAISFLNKTDWTTIPDVSNPSISNPYLTNPADFIAFRNQVRPIAINPPTTPVTFPPIPQDKWGTA